MDVILLEKVRNLGNLGDKVSVRPGYGRNYLIPGGKAVPATAENVAMLEARRAELEKAAAAALAEAQARAEKLQALEKVTVVSKAGDEGKLFGSIGTADIAEAITQAGVPVERREVLMPEGPIRQIGSYEIEVQVHSDLIVAVNVDVQAE